MFQKCIFLCIRVGNFRDYDIGVLLPAQLGHPGAAFQKQRSFEEDYDHNGTPSSLLQYLHSACHQQAV